MGGGLGFRSADLTSRGWRLPFRGPGRFGKQMTPGGSRTPASQRLCHLLRALALGDQPTGGQESLRRPSQQRHALPQEPDPCSVVGGALVTWVCWVSVGLLTRAPLGGESGRPCSQSPLPVSYQESVSGSPLGQASWSTAPLPPLHPSPLLLSTCCLPRGSYTPLTFTTLLLWGYFYHVCKIECVILLDFELTCHLRPIEFSGEFFYHKVQ